MYQNIFIEGLQGTGKSTLLTALGRKLPDYKLYREGDISPVELAWCSYMTEAEYRAALERYPRLAAEIRKWSICEKTAARSDGGCRVRYITAYTRILAEQREFYEYMEQSEIYNGRVPYQVFHDIIMGRYAAFTGEKNLFECSFFQNSIEDMMLFYVMEDEDILAFYREAFEVLRPRGFHMFYLDSPKVRENTLQIKKERSDEQGNEMWYPLMLQYLKESPYGRLHNCQDFEDLVVHFERRRRLELRIIQEILGEYCTILPAKAYDIDIILPG